MDNASMRAKIESTKGNVSTIAVYWSKKSTTVYRRDYTIDGVWANPLGRDSRRRLSHKIGYGFRDGQKIENVINISYNTPIYEESEDRPVKS